MSLATADVLGMVYGFSELGLLLFKRAGGSAGKRDRRSLSALWLVILGCVAAAVIAAHGLPRSPLLAALRPLAVALFAAGLALRWYAILYLGRYFTVDVAIAADHRVVDTGPYRYLRHPSYAGALLAFFGYGLSLANWLSLLLLTLPIALMFGRRITIEEAALSAALGAAYRDYAARTRRLIPFVW